MSNSLRRFIANMSHEDKLKALLAMVERLIELEEVSYQMDGVDVDEKIIWSANGEDICK